MNLSWDKNAWEDYTYWQAQDKKIVKKINDLIKAALRDPMNGIGKPESLKANLAGCMSRRITDEHRLVYKVYENRIHILQCRYHYD
ncbi:Txe/YoeB family addiction module toxin [Chitinophaga tropicalis]|uniref:Putative mRNA interferase YoeB n=1 Tax=Chitinophaga tropicalis TaxID=2683588 RepID=A0A7K1U5Z5_9BACT|nr:Txe/YoeB family addiction module toxin [Chitinophaga tropicalis]MVT09777.1 Txe/YoeB family addiction module toxin [Chitinophaga tropicalis]